MWPKYITDLIVLKLRGIGAGSFCDVNTGNYCLGLLIHAAAAAKSLQL